VVTLDWIMPRLSGLQVCRALRDDIALVGTPVVFITVLDDPRDRAIARRCGADSFVCKSAGAAAIVDVVRRLAAEGRSFADSPRGALRAR
jgi:two-component system phosphate regulon response regulator PhoB